MAITPLPTPPQRSDPTNFPVRADAFMTALPTFATEVTAAQVDITAKQAQTAIDSANSAAAATAAAASSVAAASVAAGWVSGTTYAIGNLVWSPLNYLTYRRKTAGTGTTDPSLDTTAWASVVPTASAGASLYLSENYGAF